MAGWLLTGIKSVLHRRALGQERRYILHCNFLFLYLSAILISKIRHEDFLCPSYVCSCVTLRVPPLYSETGTSPRFGTFIPDPLILLMFVKNCHISFLKCSCNATKKRGEVRLLPNNLTVLLICNPRISMS